MAEKYEKAYKRYGVRYGRTTKAKLGNVEKEQKKTHICPYCKNESVKRIAKGIWGCKKCQAKFTGKAYTFDPKTIRK